MARNQGYLVSYISKLTEYCDVLILKGCSHIGTGDIVKNLHGGDVNLINLSSPIINSRIKDNPDLLFNSLEKDRLNIINNIHYNPELIRHIRSMYAKLAERPGSGPRYKLVITTAAQMSELDDLAEILQEKLFTTTLYTSSVAEAKAYSANIIDKLYAADPKSGTYPRPKIDESMKMATFENFNPKDPDKYFDSLLNHTISLNFLSLYKLNSSSKAVKTMLELASCVGTATAHRSIMKKIELDDITYPEYYNAIIDSFLGFEVPKLNLSAIHEVATEEGQTTKKNVPENSENYESRFYFLDSNLLAYLLGTQITRRTYGDFFTFNKIFQNFILAELKKLTSAAAGIELSYIHEDGMNFNAVMSRDGSRYIVFKIRSTDEVTIDDVNEIKKAKEKLGDKFYRGYVIYLGTELMNVDQDGTADCWALPVSYLWSDRT